MVKIFKSNYFFFTFLFLVVFIIYGKAINFNLTNLDDNIFILKNKEYLSNLKNIPDFFLKDCYFEKRTQYYRPILVLSFSIEHFLFGTNLKIFHITSIIFFIFALFLIFLFLSKLGLNKSILKFIVLLFAVHPILSSIPVWIPARNDTLLTIFFLLSLINFINYVKTNSTQYLFFHFLFLSLSLFSKETTLLLIFIYPLLIYCFNLKINKKQILNNILFLFPLLIIYFLLRYHAVYPIKISIYFNNYLYYIKNIIVGIMLYIERIVYPTEIPIMLYDIKPTIQTYSINFFVLLSLFYIYYKKIINSKIFIFVISFSFLAILPTFAQENYALLNHRLITSLPGIVILLTILFEKIIIKYFKIKKYLIVSFLLLFLLFSFCSFINIGKYKDSFTYWNNAYKDAPNYYLVCDGLSKEYKEQNNLKKAKDLALKAINLNDSVDNNINLIVILIKEQNLNISKNILYKLLESNKDNILIYINLSTIFLYENNYSKAIEYAKKAVEYSKNHIIDIKINSLENIARVYAISKQYQEAINILFELLQYNSKNNPRYYSILSLLYEDLNDYDNSIIYIRKALEIEPNNEEYTNQLKNIKTKISTK